MMLRREKVRPETVERMRGWDHSGFAVNSDRKIEACDRKGLEGLLGYMERPPVSLRRLTYRQEDGLVHHQGTRFHPRLGTDHQLLPTLDFLALLVPATKSRSAPTAPPPPRSGGRPGGSRTHR